ncbi:xanthine dehydrogenase family protein molybdopterin-binding subunit [Lederbergia panacisoli]|uniref:xanthine dehydrogenase family protein molybdopterin-binding subunit n=1 Tax=Lederbergia panacisoli TaxID=1255251 RepID=UPI00214B1082|nr:xanthine dehydrogenase family protein molybdopterin-binding subunit [Lederbergia panacisoli]MCR2821598.1 xanthine dehydrogenase family protein molybdopterin-binding subunit [Lederbergia panacisoli]
MKVHSVGYSLPRKEGWEKVTGFAKYVDDHVSANQYHIRMVTSPYAHAKIENIDTTEAWKVRGVKAIITGKDFPVLTGPIIGDRPPIAIDKVRYNGEVVAIAVADTELHALQACEKIQVIYNPLPVVNSPSEAMKKSTPLVHENIEGYKNFGRRFAFPVPGTNIANHTKIRKGDVQAAFAKCDVIVESSYAFNPSDHVAMEPRAATCEIKPNGKILLETCSQGPYYMKKMIGRVFDIDEGDINVKVPFVGGGFGGKGAIHLEYIAIIASKAIGGRKVKIRNTREEDLITSPCHIGLEAKVKIGATKQGYIQAMEITFLFDGGAYSDMGIVMSKSAGAACTGPYNIPNVWCDSYCMYTNHPYSTSFRGFGHPEITFAIERTMDLLAKKLNTDPFTIRILNAIKPNDTTPTQALLKKSNIGNVAACLQKLKEILNWEAPTPENSRSDKIRMKGISAFWKTSSTPTDAGSGAVITFNHDGSCNVKTGAVELGQGTKTMISQMVAEKLKMSPDHVHVTFELDTDFVPEHWKTVASSSTFMTGRAAIEAADDVIFQLKQTASIVLRALPEDLDVGSGKIFLRSDPSISIDIKDISMGYKFPNGNAIGGQVIGRGNYIVPHLSELDPDTGKGKPGPWWSVGAQGIEVEFDKRTNRYEMIQAVSVIDAGTIINPMAAQTQIMGGMHMGLSFATRETFVFNSDGMVLNPDLRSYKITRFGENPFFMTHFIETPSDEGPFGARGLGEYGVIGMPAALANCLSNAANVELNILPLTPETIWRERLKSK